MLEDGFTELDLSENLEDKKERLNRKESYTEECHSYDNKNVSESVHEKLSQVLNSDKKMSGHQDSPVVRVTNPVKVGEGISSYITYNVVTKFQDGEFCVLRRFSDFLGLHEKLVSRYLCDGIIIPPAPTKDVLGTTKVIMSKDASIENEFVERRRLALERFLTRILSHPVLFNDINLREFLQHSGELPRSTNTQLLSGAAAKKMMKNFGDAIGKLTYRMDDPEESPNEEFFFQKADELDCWEKQLKRLHSTLLSLVSSENELASAKANLSRLVLLLSNVEENTGLAQALNHLADTEEQIAHLHCLQAEGQSCHLADFARETLGIVQACKDVLSERVRCFRTWKANEAALRSKREQKVRMEISKKGDSKKLAALTTELEDLERRVEQSQIKFDTISNTIKREFELFDTNRFVYFKQSATEYLELMLQIEMKVLEHWEKYLSHAESIN